MSVYRLVAEAVVGQVVEAVVAAAARRTVGAVVGDAAPPPRSGRPGPRLLAERSADRVRVKSDTPGRVRLAVPWLRGDRTALLDLLAGVRDLPGLRDASGNTLTGTLLVRYDPTRLDVDGVLAAVRRCGAARPDDATPRLAV